ncbi:uncharacterized protein LOC127434867 isoform X2 [Myxocyprinus asiaticus]|uniref:uncharacterized protein LOC127434867 isoform X2 n=1 Tax=Myxocyprinus asiaticus TaxID=70543 RepID=UPI0022237A4E|nr:uncharacterized protein LOC127434867 isoform X2 [Myxocyprinus asiaticus]
MDALWTKPIEDPLSLMSFMVPPLRLLSAAMWQVTEQRQVKHYGMLEEFVTMVTEAVPELLNYRQRAQLILGLRARLLLESCRVKNQVDMDNLQPQLDRIRGPRVNTTLSEVDKDIEESETHFLDLVHTIINNPVERENFFQNVFPVEYGPKFDKTIHTLMEDFLLQLDRMISVPDLSQTVSWLRACPSLLDKCLQSISVPKQMKILLEHQRANGHLLENESLPLVRVVIPSEHTESGDPSELGNDLDGLEDDCHSSITSSDFHISGWSAMKGKLKKETNELMEREDEDDDDDDDNNDDDVNDDDDEEYLPTKSDRGTLAHSRNQTSIKKTLGKSNKRKRDDKDVEVSREFTFINHLGAYTDEASYPTTEASKVPWTDEETFSLIDIWGKDSIQRTLKDCAHNRHIFNLISKMMSERGFARTAEQCHTRIKRLKMSFRQCHESNMRGKVRPEWKFYNLLEKILCGKDSFTNQEVRINAKDDTISDKSTGQQEEEDTTDQEFLGHAGQEDTRNVSWTDLETQTLIKIWGEDRTQRELRGVHQNGHIFAMISKKMAAHGYIRTAEQCQTRMKRLKQCFKQCYENNLSTEGKEQAEFKFYKQMEKIMSNEESSHMLLTEVKDEESDSEYQVYTYQDIETAVNCTDDRKKVAWSDAETLILLQLWGDEQVQQNLQRCPHNGHIYSEISAKLNAHGYPRSAEQCQTRIKRLKISYRQCRDRISSSEAEHVDFKFYDLMEDIFQKNSSPKVSEVPDNESFSTIKSESQEACSSVEQTASGFWLDAETEALIDVWAEDEVQNALRGSVHNGHVFADIAEKLNSQGFLKTPEQCRLKIKNMRKNFRQCYEKKKCGIKEVGFKFYDKLEQVLGDEDFSTDDFEEKDDQDAESQWAGVVAVTESGRKMPWSHQETQALLEIWGEGRVQHSLKSSLKNRHIYRYISKKMAALGFNRTGEQCHSRVKRLKAQFYYEGKEECKFYDRMEQILLKDTSTDKTSDEQDISELESITDSDSESAALSKPPSGEGPKLTWGDVETRALISIWGSDKIQEKLKVSVIRRPIFEQIAQAMADKGFSRTAEQCRTRIKRLKASYRQCLDSYRNNGEKVYWKFFNQIKKIFEKYPYLDEAETTVTQKPKTVGRETASTSANA